MKRGKTTLMGIFILVVLSVLFIIISQVNEVSSGIEKPIIIAYDPPPDHYLKFKVSCEDGLPALASGTNSISRIAVDYGPFSLLQGTGYYALDDEEAWSEDEEVFCASVANWQTAEIEIPPMYFLNNFRFRFKCEQFGVGDLFIDNFEIIKSTSDEEDIQVFYDNFNNHRKWDDCRCLG